MCCLRKHLSAAFFYWAMPESGIQVTGYQSLVTPTIRGKESSHMYGVRSFGSVPTCSGWGFSTHRAFSSVQDDDTRGRKGSHLGDMLRVLELAVLYYDTSRPLETEVPQRDFQVWPNPKRRLACPLRRLPVRPNGPRRRRRMDPRSGVKNYVRLPVSLKRHLDRSGGIFFADR